MSRRCFRLCLGFLVAIVAFSTATALATVPKKKTHRDEDGLVGPVESVTEWGYSASHLSYPLAVDGRLTVVRRPRDPHTVTRYRMTVSPGNRDYVRWYDGENLRWEINYCYDDDGYLIEEKFDNHVSHVWEKVTYEYDHLWNWIMECEWDMWSRYPLKWYEYRYDQTGNMVSRTEYVYDEFSPNRMRETSWVRFEYDSRGNVITESEYSPEGVLFTKATYKYDARGSTREEISYTYAGSLEGSVESRVIDRRDKTGHLLEHIEYDSRGTVLLRETYRRDERGNVIEYAKYVENNVLAAKYAFEYVYDSYGNWIVKSESHWTMRFGEMKLEPYKATFREIEYHP